MLSSRLKHSGQCQRLGHSINGTSSIESNKKRQHFAKVSGRLIVFPDRAEKNCIMSRNWHCLNFPAKKSARKPAQVSFSSSADIFLNSMKVFSSSLK
jgi:hypothetical protein